MGSTGWCLSIVLDLSRVQEIRLLTRECLDSSRRLFATILELSILENSQVYYVIHSVLSQAKYYTTLPQIRVNGNEMAPAREFASVVGRVFEFWRFSAVSEVNVSFWRSLLDLSYFHPERDSTKQVTI
ncbi:hypothetical protein AVEN_18739-1 [Araneus ventricosus]|uniref:Uncharacterized protein n=1 Tax=Araneus ventricosus TaxID=182803 RepID=A0A4Y2GMH0_ARAVE|nr:hypothetical protein AVEN_18739-1 [Araneus ventricosus]